MGFELVALPLEQALPAVLRRDDGRPVVRRPGQLVGHLEEEQEGDLLRVGHVRQPVVAQDVGEVPGFVDDLLGVVASSALCLPVVRAVLAGASGRRGLRCDPRSRVPRIPVRSSFDCRFVGGVLRHELPLEGPLQDALPKATQTLFKFGDPIA